MPRSEEAPWEDKVNEQRAKFMAEHGLTMATWDSQGLLSTASRPAGPPLRPAQAAPERPAGPAAKLASAFAEKLKREHDTRFAASHFRPRLDVPEPKNDVPRAVRDREAERGRTSSNKRRR